MYCKCSAPCFRDPKQRACDEAHVIEEHVLALAQNLRHNLDVLHGGARNESFEDVQGRAVEGSCKRCEDRCAVRAPSPRLPALSHPFADSPKSRVSFGRGNRRDAEAERDGPVSIMAGILFLGALDASSEQGESRTWICLGQVPDEFGQVVVLDARAVKKLREELVWSSLLTWFQLNDDGPLNELK